MPPAHQRPEPFVEIEQDDLGDHLGPGDRAGDLAVAAGEDHAEHEGIDAAECTPRYRLDERTRVALDATQKEHGRSAALLCGRVNAHAGQIALHVARGLAQPLFVLDHREADIAYAVFAIADARRDRDLGMGQKLLGEFEAAEMGERWRQWGPGEHRRARGGDVPARTAEA